jgi:hypothetical protein
VPPTPKKVDPGTKYRYTGPHATILESGQPLGPGEYVTLTNEELTGQNHMLVEAGRLIDASDIPDPGVMPEVNPEAAPATTEGSEK